MTYLFNVCGVIEGPTPAACESLNGLQSASALILDDRGTLDTNDDYCYLISTYDPWDQSSVAESLLDAENPSIGMKITYFGAYCSNEARKQFDIHLNCSDTLIPVVEDAVEYEHCKYSVTLHSIHSCPLECSVSNLHLCGGNGRCGYDGNAGVAQCMCNEGEQRCFAMFSSSISKILFGMTFHKYKYSLVSLQPIAHCVNLLLQVTLEVNVCFPKIPH